MMLFTDHLDEDQMRIVRKIVHAESFGLNEVELQPNGTAVLSGYLTPQEIYLNGQITQQLSSSGASIHRWIQTEPFG